MNFWGNLGLARTRRCLVPWSDTEKIRQLEEIRQSTRIVNVIVVVVVVIFRIVLAQPIPFQCGIFELYYQVLQMWPEKGGVGGILRLEKARG